MISVDNFLDHLGQKRSLYLVIRFSQIIVILLHLFFRLEGVCFNMYIIIFYIFEIFLVSGYYIKLDL